MKGIKWSDYLFETVLQSVIVAVAIFSGKPCMILLLIPRTDKALKGTTESALVKRMQLGRCDSVEFLFDFSFSKCLLPMY